MQTRKSPLKKTVTLHFFGLCITTFSLDVCKLCKTLNFKFTFLHRPHLKTDCHCINLHITTFIFDKMNCYEQQELQSYAILSTDYAVASV